MRPAREGCSRFFPEWLKMIFAILFLISFPTVCCSTYFSPAPQEEQESPSPEIVAAQEEINPQPETTLEQEQKNTAPIITPGQKRIVIDGKEVCRAGFYEKDGNCVFGYDKIIDKNLADNFLYGADTARRSIFTQVRESQNPLSRNIFMVSDVSDDGERIYGELIPKQFTSAGLAGDPAISPSGRYIAYHIMDADTVSEYSPDRDVNNRVEIVDLKTKEMKIIEYKDMTVFGPVSWAPDERHIACFAQENEGLRFEDQMSKICILAINVETLKNTRIYCAALNNIGIQTLQWSPSGTHILLNGQKEIVKEDMDGNVESRTVFDTGYHTIDIFGKNLKPLATINYDEYYDFTPYWSADGEWVIISRVSRITGNTANPEYLKIRYDGSSGYVADGSQTIVDQSRFPYFRPYY